MAVSSAVISLPDLEFDLNGLRAEVDCFENKLKCYNRKLLRGYY